MDIGSSSTIMTTGLGQHTWLSSGDVAVTSTSTRFKTLAKERLQEAVKKAQEEEAAAEQ